MKLIQYECPICYKCFDSKISQCDCCGFDKLIQYPHRYLNEEEAKDDEDLLLFHMLKYTKWVYSGKIPFEKDIIEINDASYEDKIYVLGASGQYGLSYVDCHNDARPVVALDGLLAFNRTKALILNVDTVSSMVLDESQVRILFLGPDVKSIDGGFLRVGMLKYLFVDSKNKFFSSDNNVLFNKDKTRLILYPSLKNEEEYKVPESVKIIGTGAFRCLKHLKTLYIPTKARLLRNAVGNADNPDFKIIRY